MVDLAGFNNKKERILSQIRVRGPSLPVQIARSIDVDGIFAGAFLSELFAEKKIKMSNMKVGSSPLYYIEGQENMLENFIEHLNIREKEAFFLLKKEKILNDESLTPVMRVALRAIKDFAIPIRVRANGDSKLFWKYFLLDNANAKELLEDSIGIDKKIEKETKKETDIKAKEESAEKTEELKEEKDSAKTDYEIAEKTKEEVKNKKKEKISKEVTPTVQEFINVKKKSEKNVKENEFGKKIKDYLSGKDIEILDIYFDKKKEFIARVRTDIIFGKQEYYLIAKDKKNVSDNDLSIALQAAQGKKMPALVISPGILNKKALEHLKDWGNLVKWEKVKL